MSGCWGAGAWRRIAGLRREELAMLAGISSDYYLRLEQDGDTHPSAQVLDALARATDRRQGQRVSAPAGRPSSRGRDPAGIDAADGVDELIDQFPIAAIVASRCVRAGRSLSTTGTASRRKSLHDEPVSSSADPKNLELLRQ
jgi:transcriptional regulator with XRE-family HTH domain